MEVGVRGVGGGRETTVKREKREGAALALGLAGWVRPSRREDGWSSAVEMGPLESLELLTPLLGGWEWECPSDQRKVPTLGVETSQTLPTYRCSLSQGDCSELLSPVLLTRSDNVSSFLSRYRLCAQYRPKTMGFDRRYSRHLQRSLGRLPGVGEDLAGFHLLLVGPRFQPDRVARVAQKKC